MFILGRRARGRSAVVFINPYVRKCRMERINEGEKTFRNVDSGVKYLFRGPKLDLGVILLKPGEKMGVHGHNQVEEIFYFIQGAPKMLVNDVPHGVKEGDAFRIDPLEKHDIHNDTDLPVKVVFIKCPYLPDDKISYDSNE